MISQRWNRSDTGGAECATGDAARPLAAAAEIAVPPRIVWQVISDVRRTSQWSPECRRVVPLGPVREGCWMLGINHRRRVWWVTLSRIGRFAPKQEIAWRVVTNGSVWSYRLSATPRGTRVAETRGTPGGAGRVADWFTRMFLGGQRDNDNELEAGMAHGLQRIKDIAENHVTPPAS
jgi:hypothetical protein